MKKNMMFLLIIFTVLLSSFTYGDIAPKPSVVVDFKGIDSQEYYVTLLSEIADVGPYYAVEVRPNESGKSKYDEDYHIWEKFLEYRDADNFYFLQYMNECSKSNQFRWTYYPLLL